MQKNFNNNIIMITIQLQLLFSPCLVFRPLLPHYFPAPLGPRVGGFCLVVGGEGGALAHYQCLEVQDVHGGIFLSSISRHTWGHIYVFANTFLHFTLFKLVCSSTLHLNIRYMMHFICVRSTHSLFSLLPLKPGLSLPLRLKELSPKLLLS